jgi:carboxymethylenebutenolidase
MQVRDGERQGWYAAPKTPSRRGVVIIHEIAGLNDDMRRIAGIFAEHGYHALVPRLFRSFGCLLRSLRELNSGPGSGEVADEVESWRQWLGHLQGAEQVAVCGFCMGGGFALGFAATHGDRGLPVVAAHYAAVPDDVSRSCPVVASYGEKDRLFRNAGQKLTEELARHGIDHDVKTYPGVGHSFMQRYGGWQQLFVKVPGPMAISYDEATAKDAWRRLFTFFDRHLSQPEG